MKSFNYIKTYYIKYGMNHMSDTQDIHIKANSFEDAIKKFYEVYPDYQLRLIQLGITIATLE